MLTPLMKMGLEGAWIPAAKSGQIADVNNYQIVFTGDGTIIAESYRRLPKARVMVIS